MQVWFKPNWCGLNRRFDVIEWRETNGGEQPAVADNDEAEDGAVHRMGVLVLACRVCFATGPRDLAFVRGLRPTKRTGAGCVPYLECEKAHLPPICDRPGTRDKLGKLWTWDSGVRGGVFVVIEAKQILHSVPMLPRFVGTETTWDMANGVYRNPFVLDARDRPPYQTTCKCINVVS